MYIIYVKRQGQRQGEAPLGCIAPHSPWRFYELAQAGQLRVAHATKVGEGGRWKGAEPCHLPLIRVSIKKK